MISRGLLKSKQFCNFSYLQIIWWKKIIPMAVYVHKPQVVALNEIEMWKEAVVKSIVGAAMHPVLVCFPINLLNCA